LIVAGSAESTADTVRRLRAGGILLLATDTVPGLHCRVDDPVAVARLVELKGRPAGKPLLVLAGSLAQARLVTGGLSRAQLAACERCWPGPFSLILPAGDHISAAVTAGGATLAVRVPAVPVLRELILAVGVPLVSSSANASGEPPATDLAAAGLAFGKYVDGLWGETPAVEPTAMPSAVVDLTVSPFVVLRPGPQMFPVV